MLKHMEQIKNTSHAAEYFKDKLSYTLGPVELKSLMEDSPQDIQLIDVRTSEHYDSSHIESAISIPASDLNIHLNKLSKEKINIVYCYTQQCHLAAKCALTLAENGYPVMELEGGFDAWKNGMGFDVVS